MPTKSPDTFYDKDADVLYISTQPGRHGIARESLPGVLWRYNPDDGSIVGVTIIDFSCYWVSRLDDLASDLMNHLPLGPPEASSLLQAVP